MEVKQHTTKIINGWRKKLTNEEIRKYLETMKMETKNSKIYGMQQKKPWEGSL